MDICLKMWGVKVKSFIKINPQVKYLYSVTSHLCMYMHMDRRWTGGVCRRQTCVPAAAVWEETGGNAGGGTLSADSSVLRQHSRAARAPRPDWQFRGRFLPQVNIF